ncbi:hypothetical protein Q8F55_006371 [Vanrija albida]|uniref:UBA domain-containing protein n=1 Tax=Vanrija albida TaxID=181172 RepID=A0ABR3PWZ5_9TREE
MVFDRHLTINLNSHTYLSRHTRHSPSHSRALLNPWHCICTLLLIAHSHDSLIHITTTMPTSPTTPTTPPRPRRSNTSPYHPLTSPSALPPFHSRTLSASAAHAPSSAATPPPPPAAAPWYRRFLAPAAPDPASIAALVRLGYTEADASHALQATQGNLEGSANLLVHAKHAATQVRVDDCPICEQIVARAKPSVIEEEPNEVVEPAAEGQPAALYLNHPSMI